MEDLLVLSVLYYFELILFRFNRRRSLHLWSWETVIGLISNRGILQFFLNNWLNEKIVYSLLSDSENNLKATLLKALYVINRGSDGKLKITVLSIFSLGFLNYTQAPCYQK